MEWKDLAPIISSVAPTVGWMLGNLLPIPGGGALGHKGGELLAAYFNVEPTPQAVAQAINTAPTDIAIQKLKSAEGEAVAKYPALATMAQAEADQNKTAIIEVGTTMRAELADQSTGVIATAQKIWRPLFALELLVECMVMASLTAHEFWTGDLKTIQAMIPFQFFLATYFGLRFAVIGVYVWGRSNEQVAITNAVAGSAPASQLDIKTVIAAVKAALGRK